jgi:hypothetical protein
VLSVMVLKGNVKENIFLAGVLSGCANTVAVVPTVRFLCKCVVALRWKEEHFAAQLRFV